MKKFLALFGAAALLAGLCGCSQTPKPDAAEETVEIPTNDTEYVFQPVVDPASENTGPLAGGGAVTVVTGPGGTESGAEAALWQGVNTFAYNFGYVPKSASAISDSVEDAAEVLRQTADTGAQVIVCRGDTMAQAVYQIQNEYPGTAFLLFDAEVHNADYTDYQMADNVHCVLFDETQAGYLAGFAAVSEGYTQLGFVGAEEMPATVRYCTGFLQGAQKAAEQQGDQVSLKVWYTGTAEYNETVTARLADWMSSGTQVVFAADEGPLQSAREAAAQAENARVIGARWLHADAEGQAPLLLNTLHCYNAMVQQELYSYFAATGWAKDSEAGQTDHVGVTEGAVALNADTWNLSTFTAKDYEQLYENLRNSTWKVDNYADMNSLPGTPDVAVEQQN